MQNPIDINNYLTRIEKIEKILGYTFKDKSLLLRAITHPSAVQGYSLEYSYERFEFLGDSLLSSIVSVSIFKKYKKMNEGQMSHMRVAFVSGDNLSKVSKELGLEDMIIFGKSEQSTGKRGLKSALENVYEALVAAVFLDGGQIQCWRFVVRTIVDKMINNDSLAFEENPKSHLQEVLQVNHGTPVYEIIEESGPAHDKRFVAVVKLDNKVLAEGEGSSKKEAEKNAAKIALQNWKEF